MGKNTLFFIGCCLFFMFSGNGKIMGQGIIFDTNQSLSNHSTIAFESSSYIYADKDYAYTGSGNGTLLLKARGDCGVNGGFLWIRGNTNIVNNHTGNARFFSGNHYLQFDGNLNYRGGAVINNVTDTTFFVSGRTGIDIKGDVTVTMDSTGHTALESSDGHVHIKGDLKFTQHMWGFNGGSYNIGHQGYLGGVDIGSPDVKYYGENGFSILAQGDACGTGDCNNRPGLGYVWIEGNVETKNEEHGSVSIKAAHHHLAIDGDLKHRGVEGDLNVIAGTDKYDPVCDVTCPNTETPFPWYYDDNGFGIYKRSVLTDLQKYKPGDAKTAWEDDGGLTGYPPLFPTDGTLDFSHAGRGYVYIGGDVDIVMDSIGKVRIQSMSDFVQLDKALKYVGKKGSDLNVDGFYGIGILGDVTTENTAYVDTLQGDYSQKQGGRTTFYSDTGFIEIRGNYRHDAHQANEYDKFRHPRHHWRMGYNFMTPNYQNDFRIAENHGHGRGSSLTMDAYRRIRFHQDVTVCIDSAYGYAKFYARKGFIDFKGVFTFDGTPTATHQGINPDQGSVSTPGDLLILAYGITAGGRSALDTFPACRPSQGGLVLFQDDAKISFADTGRTIIRSLNGDIMIFKNFTYVNNQTAGIKNENGQFWMQAGQDILGGDTISGTRAYGKTISFTHAGEKSIVMEAKGTIHTEQGLLFDRKDAKAGSILLKAGYDYYGDKPFRATPEEPASLGIDWTKSWSKANVNTWCPPENYDNRKGGKLVCEGGDIWFEGSVKVDLSRAAASNTDDSIINTMAGALHAIYIDSSFTYEQSQMNSPAPGYVSGYLNLFAHEGNIEAIKNGLFSGTKGVPGTSVDITVSQSYNTSEISIQSGNDPLFSGGISNVMECYNPTSEWVGNILFNKPLNITSRGKGSTLISAERDIEAQADAPFVFTYTNTTDSLKDFYMTAGRHIETHKKMIYNYSTNRLSNASITLESGRLDPSALPNTNALSKKLCKVTESGSALTADYQPSPGSNRAAYEPYGTFENNFSKGGAGHGSIFLFDSLEFNYDGHGTILLSALNGNIESDPYLHKNDAVRGNTSGKGYDGAGNIHDAQLTFNHSGTGAVKIKAIDIRLHDKLAYYGASNNNKNGDMYLSAFDSILTRTIYYENKTDAGSVYITTDKYKAGSECQSDEYAASTGGPGINQGHILLGYGADCNSAGDDSNENDSIVFNFAGNQNTSGANVLIRAGYEGFSKNRVTGRPNTAGLFTNAADRGKGYGGNITFDFLKAVMAKGNHTSGGYMEISTPNGNIWGKDSLQYSGANGDLLVDAGLGSLEDLLRATRWSCFSDPSVYKFGNGHEDILNTSVPVNCDNESEWRTGNIMMKGGALDFNDGKGDAIFRTREGFIDTYDAFTVSGMEGDLLKYAGMDNLSSGLKNQYGDISERDFQYAPTVNSGSVLLGADDNIMLNYGNSNFYYPEYGAGTGMGFPGDYDVAGLNAFENKNPYYFTSYEGYIDDLCAATFDVNKDGYLFYKNRTPLRTYHRLYRGCIGKDCSGDAGKCVTTSNGARNLEFNFNEDASDRRIRTGGFAAVASNYIDLLTTFTYYGGTGTGIGDVPGMRTLHGESVSGFGLYIKSQFNGEGQNTPEKRRNTCENCGDEGSSFPIGDASSEKIPEMTYIGFHDDARIHTHHQKSLLEAPVIEVFGHAEINTETNKGDRTNITLKSDSLIFHDSVIFAGNSIMFKPFTTDAARRSDDMRYGVLNDRGKNAGYYRSYGPAIEMTDRGLPVLELGYQRCYEPGYDAHDVENIRSKADLEPTPKTGGDVVVAFKYGFKLPIFNTIVANHARISFLPDLFDGVEGGEYTNTLIRTDLLRIRNKVSFFTDPAEVQGRKGHFALATPEQMDDQMTGTGIYMRHLHMEPGSELSLPGEDSLLVMPTTVVGGYGNIHENVLVKANAILAPGLASLMESDCQTPHRQGTLTIHNLKMEKDAVLRLSIGKQNPCVDENGNETTCTGIDKIVVEDTVRLYGKIPVVLLPEVENIEPGCYLFMEYGDSLGLSSEYVMNLELVTQRYGDNHCYLYFGEAGKVYVCVSEYNIPGVYRHVELPSVKGVTTDPCAGRHPVRGSQHFRFIVGFEGVPLKVRALGYYSGESRDLDYTAREVADNTYQYTLKRVTEPWTIQIGPEYWSGVSNENIDEKRIWSYKNILYVNAEKEDVMNIYNMAGVLYKTLEIPEGMSKFTLERGVYAVVLKDGTMHKIVIR